MKFVLLFLSLLSLTAVFWWLFGYNFDHRSPDVAMAALMSVIGAGGFTMILSGLFGWVDV